MESDRKRQFTQRFVRNQHRVFAFIVTLLPDRNEAEEAFQETSLLLWERWDEFDPEREFVPWACAFAFNVVRNRRKKNRRSPTALSEDVLAAVAETRHRTEELLQLRRQALSTCVADLPSEARDLVKRCYWSGDTFQTVAETLKMAPQTLYKRLQRIRRTLFECINRKMAGEAVP
jgi:RNA polymerase sigma-70 factor (ECF subfamily)